MPVSRLRRDDVDRVVGPLVAAIPSQRTANIARAIVRATSRARRAGELCVRCVALCSSRDRVASVVIVDGRAVSHGCGVHISEVRRCTDLCRRSLAVAEACVGLAVGWIMGPDPGGRSGVTSVKTGVESVGCSKARQEHC